MSTQAEPSAYALLTDGATNHHVEGAWPAGPRPCCPGARAEGSHPAGRCTPPGGC